jgi:hypothetical protein
MSNRRFRSGWYCAALRRELSPEHDRERAFCGRSLRLRVSEDGKPTAEIAGRAAPVCVHDGVVFVWHGRDGEAPSYELPDLDHEGFTPSTFDAFEVRASPALIMRDLADYPHFESIHGYRRVAIDAPFAAHGACCALTVSFDWPLILGSGLVTLRARFRSVCVGLGYQVTTVTAAKGMFVTRHRVLPTPTEDGVTRVTLGMEIQLRGGRPTLPRVDALGHAIARRAFTRDTATDSAGWQALSEEEATSARGPLADYWAWANQFRAGRAASDRGRSTNGSLPGHDLRPCGQ